MKFNFNDNRYNTKINASINFMKHVISKHDNPVVACSFGKNSMVVLDIARRIKPNIMILFNDTYMEFPEIYEYKDLIVKRWKLNIIETRPSKTFWWVVEKYGFPLFARKGNKDATKNCCRYLKEYPIEKVCRKHKFDLYMTGLSRHESRLREFSAKKYGKYFYSKRNKHWKCHPIQNWMKEGVWYYHNKYRIPKNKFYDKKVPNGYDLRTGCWCCTIPIRYGKIEFLRVNYPKLWKTLLKKGLAKIIIESKIGMELSGEELEVLMKNRPCYFDKI